MDFSQFKKNRAKATETVQKMKEKIQKPAYGDDRFWSLKKDDSKVGEAIIRFLPQQDVEKHTIVMYYNHSFDLNGKKYWENCPSTLSRECPACEYTQPFWDEKTEAGKQKAMKFGRKKNFVTNILVVKDPQQPENNGKVFLFRFGVGIFDKIMEKLAPESALLEADIIHDMWEGRNFHLQSKDKGGYANYDLSSFVDKKTPVAGTDKEIETIYVQITDLDEFIEESKFKSYDELADKLEVVTKKTVEREDKKTDTKDDKKKAKKKDETPKEEPEDDIPPFDTDTKEDKKSEIYDDFSFTDDDFNFDE